MRTRSTAPFALFVGATLSLTIVPAGARSQNSAKAKAASARPARAPAIPRTRDGRPDLQGVWNFGTITPLERPTDLAGKETLSDEDAAQLEQRAAQNRVDRPPRPGDPGTYNQFWLDFGTKVVPTKRTSLIVDPPDGRLPSATLDAQKRAASIADGVRRSEGPEDRPVYERCILGFNAGPPIMPSGYNNFLQIVQTAGYVAIMPEMVHDPRIIPLDKRTHGKIRQWRGDSIGRWDGDTLVVDTINFRREGTGTISLRPTADENLHLIERFTRTDADTLLYEFTMDDPTTWIRPWTASIPMSKTGDQVYEYACHEGNLAMIGMLGGARAKERAAKPATAENLR
jgi:hypothetical protein